MLGGCGIFYPSRQVSQTGSFATGQLDSETGPTGCKAVLRVRCALVGGGDVVVCRTGTDITAGTSQLYAVSISGLGSLEGLEDAFVAQHVEMIYIDIYIT